MPSSSTDGSRLRVESLREVIERPFEWLLLDGNRAAVAGAVVVVLFALAATLSLSGLTPLQDTQSLYYVFSGLLTGNMTLITVVVSINQLLLSRELQTPPELRSQIEGTIDYRRSVENAAGEVAPVEPLGFLRLLYQNTREEAQRLGGMSFGHSSAQTYDEIDDLVTELTRHVDRIDELLTVGEADTFDVLSVTLLTNYARKIHQLRRLRATAGDDVSDATTDSMERLIDRLQEIDVARQYFKTVYLQEELSTLSRILFYVGIPAEATAVAILFLFTASGGASLSRPTFLVVLPAAVTVCLVPLAVLFAFILRTATVTQRTAATVPFTTSSQEQ